MAFERSLVLGIQGKKNRREVYILYLCTQKVYSFYTFSKKLQLQNLLRDKEVKEGGPQV